MRTKGNSARAAGIEWSLPNIVDRKTWSYAPIPSTVRIVRFWVGVGGCPKHVAHTVCPCSGGEGILKRCAFCFEGLHELLGQTAGNKATHCAASRDAPDTSVWFQQCCQPCPHQCRPDLCWNSALCEQVARCQQEFRCVALVQQQFQMFVRAPAGPCG